MLTSGMRPIFSGYRLRIAVMCGLGVVAIAGCAVDDYESLESPVGWEEPGWMAQVRQQNEVYVSAMESCYDEYGLESTRGIGGGDIGFLNLPDDPATQKLFEDSATDCNARISQPEYRQDQALTDSAYERMVVTRECMVAHGYQVPEPPSKETWKDSDPWYTAWNPYEVLVGAGAMEVTDDELRALNEACPQPGPNFQVQAPSANQ